MLFALRVSGLIYLDIQNNFSYFVPIYTDCVMKLKYVQLAKIIIGQQTEPLGWGECTQTWRAKFPAFSMALHASLIPHLA